MTVIISLIRYWHVPYQAGYAFLTAYRFVPTFHDELQKIRIAHEVRDKGRGALPVFYLVPLMVQAIHIGERVAISMDARAFGISEERTYYKIVHFGAREKWAIALSAVFIAALTAVMAGAGLFVFGIGFT
ncbi:MAG: energy-coupling factor transporter transmembrane protein EcfT [Spirochaetaceae bacterium]|jgi:energy-coupling factor transport system permease protein|nr:energy-coupling factor transporter transmembrane protein EcfT [Spirochaetaceae bacterium]